MLKALRFLKSIYQGPVEQTEAYLDTILEPSFESKDEGRRLSRQEYIEHVKAVRAADKLNIERVVWLACDGPRVSVRYFFRAYAFDERSGANKWWHAEQWQDLVFSKDNKLVALVEVTRHMADDEPFWEPGEDI